MFLLITAKHAAFGRAALFGNRFYAGLVVLGGRTFLNGIFDEAKKRRSTAALHESWRTELKGGIEKFIPLTGQPFECGTA